MNFLPFSQIFAVFQCIWILYVHIPEAFLHMENTFQGSSLCDYKCKSRSRIPLTTNLGYQSLTMSLSRDIVTEWIMIGQDCCSASLHTSQKWPLVIQSVKFNPGTICFCYFLLTISCSHGAVRSVSVSPQDYTPLNSETANKRKKLIKGCFDIKCICMKTDPW